jgi:hypothetical protein
VTLSVAAFPNATNWLWAGRVVMTGAAQLPAAAATKRSATTVRKPRVVKNQFFRGQISMVNISAASLTKALAFGHEKTHRTWE